MSGRPTAAGSFWYSAIFAVARSFALAFAFALACSFALAGCDSGPSSTGNPDGGFACEPGCGAPLACCASGCVNPRNDIFNCGGCGVVCPGPAPFCSGGVCAQAPCNAGASCGAALCCGSACCAAGQICCEVMSSGPLRGASCVTPTAGGTCPTGF